MEQRILVVGGSGRTGRYVVRKLSQLGLLTRVLTRDPKQARKHFDAQVQIFEGDIIQPISIKTVMQDVNAVVVAVESSDDDEAPNSPERVHYQGTCNILSTSADTTHIVLVTQIYITRLDHYPSVRNVIYWRRQAEEAVRASGLPYTIIRPAWLTNASSSRLSVRLEQGDIGDGEVSREDVAEACVQALLNENARSKTFEIYNESGTSPNWREVFASLDADPVTIRTKSR